MKKTKKIISLLLVVVMVISLFSTLGVTSFAGYGDSGDAWHYQFTLDRIPGVDGYPGQALDKSISYIAWDEDWDGVTGDLNNGGTTVSPDHTTIQPDTQYTYTIELTYDGADPLYYGYSGVTVEWYSGNTKYSGANTYDAGHYKSSTSSTTWSSFGFTTPMTPSSYTPATVVADELVYNGAEQRLLNDDEYRSSTSRIQIQYCLDDGIWTNNAALITAKDAGTHKIEWKASGAGYNSNIANSGTLYKEIKKLQTTVTPKANQSKIYGMNDPVYSYDIVATNGALVVPEVDLENGMLKEGALSRVQGENYTPDGYKYTIGTLQTANATNYDITFVDNTTVFMINRKNITSGGVDISLPAPDGGFDGDIYQYYYTADKITPAISLIYSGAEVESIKNENLALNKDYNITDGQTVREYINHENSFNDINIRGIGNYIGVTDLNWRVIKLNFNDGVNDITADSYEADYDGQAHGIKVNLNDTAINADAEITYIYDADSATAYTAENWDESKATSENPTFTDVLVDNNNSALTRTVYYRVHSPKKDGGGSFIYNDFYGSATVLINKKTVTLVPDEKTKVYDKDPSTDPELTYADYTAQMIGEETLEGIQIYRTQGQNVGNYNILFNLTEINRLNTNYNVIQQYKYFKITKRPIKVSVGEYEKIYSEVNPTLALTIEKAGEEGVAPLEGLVAGDVLTDETLLGTTLAFKDADDKSWTYDRFIDAGVYTIEKGTLANPNYDIDFTNGTFTVAQKDISLEDTNVVMLYNGSRIDPVFTYTGKTITPEFTMSDEQDGVEYVNHEGDIDFEVKGVFKASDYGIFPVSIRGIHNYTGEIKGKWAILPTIDKTVDYDGNYHTIEFDFGESFDDGTATTVRFSESAPTEPVTAASYDLATCPSYKNAGVYKIYYGIVQNAEEYGEEGVFSGVATLTINTVPIGEIDDINKPSAKLGLVYNGEPQALVVDPVELPEYCSAIKYSVDGGETWVDTPTAINAGVHTVKVMYIGDRNHSDFLGDDITASIAKLQATVTPDDGQSKIYGELDPTYTYTIKAVQAGKSIPAGDLENGMLKTGAISREEGENYKAEGYKYTIGNLQDSNSNYALTVDDTATVFMIERKNINDGGVSITLPEPDGGFDGDIYQYYYTADKIIPAISIIYYGAPLESIKDENLELNKDYNITDGKTVREYINHGDQNETITIRGIGNYIGVATLDWRVIKLNFGDITSENYAGVYDGEAHGITVNLTDVATAAYAEITYIYDESGTVYNEDNWDESKATSELPTFTDVLVDDNNEAIARTVYYRVHSPNKDGGDSFIYNDFYGCDTVLITKKDVNLVAENQTKVYDRDPSTDPALTYEDYSEQMIGEEKLDGVVIAREEGQDAGNYAIFFNLAEINLLNTNYNVTETQGTFEITARPVKVSVGDYAKIYSEVNPTLALTIEKAGEEGVADLEGLVAEDVLFDETQLGTALAFVDAEGNTWAYDRFIDAGEYTIAQGALANPNYDITFTNGTFTVAQKDISLEDTNVVMLYNGSRIDPVFTYTGKTITPEFTMSDEQDGVEYVNHEGDIDFEVKGIFKASDYGIFPVSIRGIHNYTGEIKGKWAILPTIDKTVDYDGNEHSLVFDLGESLNDGTATGIRFSETAPTEPITAASYDLTECPSYVNSGVYNVYYGIIKNADEYGEEGVFSGVATLTINKVDMGEITEQNIPTAKEDLVYNAQEQDLVNYPSVLPEGCAAIQYSLDGGETWSDKAVATNAGDYTVMVKYVPDCNHYGKDGETINVSIAIATINPEVTLEGWTYGEEPNEPVVTGNTFNDEVIITYAQKGSEEFTSEVPVNAGDYVVKAYIAATDNTYEGVATADFNIAKAPVTITAANKTIWKDAAFAPLTYTVSGKVVEGDEQGIKIASEAKASVAGKYDIVVTFDNDNYDATLVNATYTVKDRVSPREKVIGKNYINSAAKNTPTKNSFLVSWGAVPNADRYEVYASYCIKNHNYKKIATLKGNVTKYNITKLGGKKVSTKQCVKAYVIAYRLVDGKYVAVAQSITMHTAGAAQGTYTNAKSIAVKNSTVNLAVGKTSQIKPTLTRQNSKKALLDHVDKFRYQSTNTKIATVSANGTVKAVSKGSCTIYVFATNGKLKSVRINVK